MKFQTLGIALMAALAMNGCKKTDSGNDASAAAAIAAASGASNTTTPAEEAKLAALPKPDLSKPLTDYAKVDSGVQVMFLYLATAKLPVDYDAVATVFSSDYQKTADTFAKHDLLAKIQPQIDSRVASVHPYGWMAISNETAAEFLAEKAAAADTTGDSDSRAAAGAAAAAEAAAAAASGNGGGDYSELDPYDFKKGGFPVREFTQPGTHRFSDARAYGLNWANNESVAFALVKDEAVARKIEALRLKSGQWPQLKVFFFAQSVETDTSKIKAFVTRVQILDTSGHALAEYGPTSPVNTGN